MELPGGLSSTLGRSPLESRPLLESPFSQCLQPHSTVGNKPSVESGPGSVDSPFVAVGMKIPVKLYDEEVMRGVR